jgi:hypothetical protein
LDSLKNHIKDIVWKISDVNTSYFKDINFSLITGTDLRSEKEDYIGFYSFDETSEMDCLPNSVFECISFTEDSDMTKYLINAAPIRKDNSAYSDALIPTVLKFQGNFNNMITRSSDIYEFNVTNDEAFVIYACDCVDEPDNYFASLILGYIERKYIDVIIIDKFPLKISNLMTKVTGDLDSSIIKIEAYIEASLSFEYIPYLARKFLYYRNIFQNFTEREFHGYLADVITIIFRNRTIYDESSSQWYMFDYSKHGWDPVKDIELSNIINSNVINILKTVERFLVSIGYNILSDTIELFIKILSTRHNISYKLISDLKIRLIMNNFLDIVDKSSLIRFRDGVLDLKTLMFRNGSPDDFCLQQCSCNYLYPKTFSEEDIEQDKKKIVHIMRTIFPDDDTYQYIMTYLSTMFIKGNIEKIVVMFLGNGNNGKTVLTNIINKVMGTYVTRGAANQLVGPRPSSSSPSEDWVKLHNKYMVIYAEVSEDKPIHNETLKMLTGREINMSARGIFAKQRDIIVDPKVIICSNLHFNMGIVDRAMINRIVVVPFLSMFVRNVELEKSKKSKTQHKYIQQSNENIEQEIGDYLTSFVRIIIETYYPLYKSNKLSMTPLVEKATADFINKGDPIQHYLNEYIQADDNNDSGANMFSVYTSFLGFMNTIGNSKKITLFDLIAHLDSKGFVIEKNILRGYKIVMPVMQPVTKAKSYEPITQDVANSEDGF